MQRKRAGGRRLATRLRQAVAKRRWTEDDARTVIDALDRSGESVAAFGEQHGLDPWRTWRWRNQLREPDPPVPPDALASVFTVALRNDEGATAGRSPIEVELPDGIIVRLASDFDTNSVRRLLDVLRC